MQVLELQDWALLQTLLPVQFVMESVDGCLFGKRKKNG